MGRQIVGASLVAAPQQRNTAAELASIDMAGSPRLLTSNRHHQQRYDPDPKWRKTRASE